MSRFTYAAYAEATRPLTMLGDQLRHASLERGLVELTLLRASQLNGCAYCIDLHSKDARAAGETEQRLYMLQAWRGSPFYSERERAAMAWCEAVTRLDPLHGVPDDVYAQAAAVFNERELLDLNLVVVLINAWNRIAIPTRMAPGSQPLSR